MRIAVADIGGTHARFALAELQDGHVAHLGDPVVLRAADHEGLASAWRAFGEVAGEALPRIASLGVAGPVTGGPVRFVNSHWVIDPATLDTELGLDEHLLVNDFGAMAHAVHALGPAHLAPLLGPDRPLPERGAISVIGPGTGLGVAVLQRLADRCIVLETEGAHIHFAPLDPKEQQVAERLAGLHGRVSVERVVSGPGLGDIVRTFAPNDGRSDAELWSAAIGGSGTESGAALDIWMAAYGSAVGDLALAHGSLGIALCGGLTNRIADQLRASDFHDRFCAKGRYRERMQAMPICLVTHPQPGLFGAAAAFAARSSFGAAGSAND